MESLAQYVKRIMKEKGLSSRDVQARSGKKIADSYVNKITSGKTKNPSISKTQALAIGLGVDEDEVFKVARGIPINESGSRGGEPWPTNILVEAITKITSSPELTCAVKGLLKAKPAKIKALLKQLEKE